MSKSLGNVVLVRDLLDAGAGRGDPPGAALGALPPAARLVGGGADRGASQARPALRHAAGHRRLAGRLAGGERRTRRSSRRWRTTSTRRARWPRCSTSRGMRIAARIPADAPANGGAAARQRGTHGAARGPTGGVVHRGDAGVAQQRRCRAARSPSAARPARAATSPPPTASACNSPTRASPSRMDRTARAGAASVERHAGMP